MKDQLCQELNLLVQQSAHAQIEKLESLTQRLEYLNQVRSLAQTLCCLCQSAASRTGHKRRRGCPNSSKRSPKCNIQIGRTARTWVCRCAEMCTGAPISAAGCCRACTESRLPRRPGIPAEQMPRSQPSSQLVRAEPCQPPTGSRC